MLKDWICGKPQSISGRELRWRTRGLPLTREPCINAMQKKATAKTRVTRYLSVGHKAPQKDLQEDEAMGIIEYVLLGLVAVTGVYLVTIYNNLVRLKHTVTKNWSNIDVLDRKSVV